MEKLKKLKKLWSTKSFVSQDFTSGKDVKLDFISNKNQLLDLIRLGVRTCFMFWPL